MGGTPHVRVRDHLWPVVLFELEDGVSDAEWADMFRAYEGFYERAEMFCPVTDASQLTAMPAPSSRELLARLIRQHEPHTIQLILQAVVIVRSGMVRGALTAVHWLSPPVCPLACVVSREEAFAHVAQALERAGRAVPWGLRESAHSELRSTRPIYPRA